MEKLLLYWKRYVHLWKPQNGITHYYYNNTRKIKNASENLISRNKKQEKTKKEEQNIPKNKSISQR